MRHYMLERPKESDSLYKLLKMRRKRYRVLPWLLAGGVTTVAFVGGLTLAGVGIASNLFSFVSFGCCGALLSGAVFSFFSLLDRKIVSKIFDQHAAIFENVYPELGVTGKQLSQAVATKPKKTTVGYVNYVYFFDQQKCVRVIRETTSNRYRSTGLAVLPTEKAEPFLQDVYQKETKKGPQLVLKRN